MKVARGTPLNDSPVENNRIKPNFVQYQLYEGRNHAHLSSFGLSTVIAKDP